jgi:hypothetical protein
MIGAASLRGVARAFLIALTSVCCLGGFVLLNLPEGGTIDVVGVALLSLALVVALVAILRAGRGSLKDREREARARDQFERTGEWPSDS